MSIQIIESDYFHYRLYLFENRYLHVYWKDEKQDIEASKQDIEKQKQDIDIPDNFQPKTKRSILFLFDQYGYDQYFGRTQVMELLHITASPASTLISKMVTSGVIIPITGHGKGKYRFSKR